MAGSRMTPQRNGVGVERDGGQGHTLARKHRRIRTTERQQRAVQSNGSLVIFGGQCVPAQAAVGERLRILRIGNPATRVRIAERGEADELFPTSVGDLRADFIRVIREEAERRRGTHS
jgi:hypothetical protein